LHKLKSALTTRARQRFPAEDNPQSVEFGSLEPCRDFADHFRGTGRSVDEAIPAFSGLYPFFGGTGTWELLFTRHRLLARRGATLLVWQSHTGPTPISQLAEAPLSALGIVETPSAADAQRRYGQLCLDKT
jgi:hypothetical protein